MNFEAIIVETYPTAKKAMPANIIESEMNRIHFSLVAFLAE